MNTKLNRLAYAIALGLTFGTPVAAQTVAPAAPTTGQNDKAKVKTLETVVVTASRIALPSLSIPTPEVPIPRAELNLNANINVGAALNNLPYFRSSVTPQTGSTNQGAGNIAPDLRGLGSVRTLTLLDGHRFVGTQNLGSIPSVLIKSVQVVTGGASASWGSGAVSGVVNVLLNTKLSGLVIGGGTGISSANDARERRFEIGGGTDFAAGNGHVIFGLNYMNRNGVYPAKTKRDAIGRWVPVPLPDGRIEILPDVGQSNLALGGIINSGVLNGFGFNPDGTVTNLHYAPVVSGTTTTGLNDPGFNDWQTLIAPVQDYAFLAHVDYNITDSVTFTGQVRLSRTWNRYPWFLIGNYVTLSVDNAFLPASVRSIMTANDETSFDFGRMNKDFGVPDLHYGRGNKEVSFGLKGHFGEGWRWKVHASYGQHYDDEATGPWLLATNWEQSIDSVIDPATHAPVCRVALTDPSTSCVPINLFGVGAPSAAAINYVTSRQEQRNDRRLAVFSAEVQGEPFELPAGFASVAVGVDWRRVSLDSSIPAFQAEDPFELNFYSAVSGAVKVKEGFAEVNVPLLDGHPGLHNFTLDAAGRISDYSQSGNVASWKVGLVDGFGGGFRGRADLSQDIRAPNITELFSAVSTTVYPVFDPVKGTNQLIPVDTGGNRDLNPEKARTFTAGLSWQPPGSDRFAASLDYYHIRVNGIISSIGPQEIINRCAAGETALCGSVIRDTSGNLTGVFAGLQNLDKYKTDGVDLDVMYKRPLTLLGVGGELQFRTLGTWTHRLETVSEGVTTQFVGTLGDGFTFGVPRWKAISTLAFASNVFSANVRVRYIASGEFNRNEDIVNNHIGAYFYYDVGGSYSFGANRMFSLYANILNVSNKLPPHGVMNNFSAYYDWMGRYYRVGVKIKL